MENSATINNSSNQLVPMVVVDMDNKDQQWLKPTEVAKQLGVSSRTVLRLLATGQLAGYKIGRSVKFKPEDVDEYLKNSRIDRKQ